MLELEIIEGEKRCFNKTRKSRRCLERRPSCFSLFNSSKDIRIHMADNMGIHKDMDNMGADITARFLIDHQSLLLKTDLQKRTGVFQIFHHKTVLLYSLSYLPYIFAYITSYAKLRAAEWAFVHMAVRFTDKSYQWIELFVRFNFLKE